MIRKLLYLLLVLIPFSVATAALITGKVFIDTNLVDTPNNNGNVIESLSANTQVTVQQRQNSWTQVATTNNTGWVPTLTIRIVSVTQQQSNIDGATEVVTDRLGNVTGTQQKTVVATFGIRGIDEEKLKTAKLDEDQLKILENYKVTESSAKSFARSANLRAQKVAYFDVEVEQ